MPAKVKYELVDGLKEKLSRTKAVFVGEYRGMTVAQSTALRAKVREAGGELKIAKNTLFKIAMKETGFSELPESMMKGPNIFALCYDDPVSVAKVLKECVNDKTQKTFILKGGLLENQVLDFNQLMALAELPSKDVLRGQVVRTIAAPLSGLVNVLSGTIRNFVTCLAQIRDKKQEGTAA
ncbi:MAG: 50S ribosomal protein L10 [Synergistaceae bacterium]|nr:50S ribosomal protein L10 [Synergistaceae bacterium]MBQ6435264.1 50S ribosomal protein L10 [Synergistaceae bacterium]MBQ6737054.1 50S ribosomal protein L10 [Synergistaceae bacterium]MBQ7068330.1 50S ribosomal protein L10 [Synergistaceae bacterium]MBR0076461.1 50S ribosomal protein L10 [Synergistaceae bacterium]